MRIGAEVKAICLDENRDLVLRDIASPGTPPAGQVTVRIAAAAINPGDIFFLKSTGGPAGTLATRIERVWGASAAGIVTAIGDGVPAYYANRKVAIYRGLQVREPILGLWTETAQVPYLSCLSLPDHLDPLEYSGSLVNVATAYAFLEQASAEGHRGILITAGGSATGRAALALARRRGLPALVVVRSAAAKAELIESGVPHVAASDEPDFTSTIGRLAEALEATAVFDGVGGSLISRLLPVLPLQSNLFCYGFLSGPETMSFHSSLLMMKDLTIRRFSNFESPSVKDPRNLAAMLAELETCIDDPAFRTRIGRTFALSEFEAALRYGASDGAKAVFLP